MLASHKKVLGSVPSAGEKKLLYDWDDVSVVRLPALQAWGLCVIPRTQGKNNKRIPGAGEVAQ